MKFRQDFVTNSSSSSYIIAKHKDIKFQDILDALGDKNIESFCKKYLEYTEYADELEGLSLNEKKEWVKNYIAEEINSLSEDLTLDNWDIKVEEGSNDSCDMFGAFLYCSCNMIDTDKFKITSA